MMKNRWYDITASQTADILETDLKNGLDKNAIAGRVKKYGKNTVYSVKKKEESPYILRAVSGLSMLLLCLVAIIHALLQADYKMLILPVLMILSMLIIFYAYSKSKLILDENAMQSIPRTKVIRGGKLMLIRQDAIVPGDVFIISAGDIIPCDARLIETNELYVLEKGIGNEGAPVKKDAEFRSSNTLPPEQRSNMAFSLSVVVRGRGKAVAVATGKSTYLSMKGENVVINSGEKMKELSSFEKYSTSASIFMSSLVMVLTLLAIIFDLDFGIYNSFLLTLTLTVSSLCEFLPMLAGIVISCGIFGAGKRKRKINSGVMIKNSGKLDVLKDVDCIFFHKESLFAESDIRIEKCDDKGDMSPDAEKIFQSVLRSVIIAKGLYGAARLNADNEKNENIYSAEDEKIIEKAKKCGIYNKYLDEAYPAIDHKKQVFKGCGYETTMVKKDQKNLFYATAPALSVLKLCKFEKTENGIIPLSAERKSELENLAAEKVRSGAKVIAVAITEHVVNKSAYFSPNVLFADMIYVGMLSIERPVISGAMEYIKLCRECGIKLVMVCDDVSETNVMLAQNIGIIQSKEEAVTREELSSMSSDMIRTNIPMYNLYQGLNVPQLKFVETKLKDEEKRTVAYLGRELSDLKLVTAADVAIAELLTVTERAAKKGVDMNRENVPISAVSHKDTSRGGCEALKFSADVVVSKPDADGNGGFNSAVSSVIAAKGIRRNLYLMCEYMLLTFASRLVIVLFSMISGIMLVTPIQLIFMGAICDLIAIMMIAFEKPEKSILKNKNQYKHVNDEKESVLGYFFEDKEKLRLVIYAVISAVGTIIGIVGVFLIGLFADLEVLNVLTVTFIASIAFQLALVLEIISQESVFGTRIRIYNIYPFYVVFIGAVVTLGMMFPFFGNIMNIVPLTVYEWIGAFVPAVMVIVIFEVYKLIARKRSAVKNKERTEETQ